MKMAIQKGAYTCGSASAHSRPRKYAVAEQKLCFTTKPMAFHPETHGFPPRSPWLSATKPMAFHPETPIIQPLAYIREGMKQYR